MQGISSQSVFFETLIRISHYDIFKVRSTICVLLLGFYFINVTWPPQPLILMASMTSFFFVISRWVIWCNINLIFWIHLYFANNFRIPIKKFQKSGFLIILILDFGLLEASKLFFSFCQSCKLNENLWIQVFWKSRFFREVPIFPMPWKNRHWVMLGW